MEYPDEYLPPLQLGLEDLVTRGAEYLGEGTSAGVDKFIKLILAGRATIDHEEHRVLVNASQGDDTMVYRDEVTLTGDFDSLIGFSKTLPLRTALSVYPVPSFKHTLTKPIHVTWQIPVHQVSL